MGHIRLIQDYLARKVRGPEALLPGDGAPLTPPAAKQRFPPPPRHTRQHADTDTLQADKHHVPKVDNTNIDTSVALIHLTIMG
jgi:hypothetical protein